MCGGKPRECAGQRASSMHTAACSACALAPAARYHALSAVRVVCVGRGMDIEDLAADGDASPRASRQRAPLVALAAAAAGRRQDHRVAEGAGDGGSSGNGGSPSAAAAASELGHHLPGLHLPGTTCPAASELGHHLPGLASIWVHTLGCSHNISDSEYMEGALVEYGYELVDDSRRDAADLWLLNTCTVKGPSQASMNTLLERGRALGKRMVVAGCVPQGDRRARELQGLSLLGVTQIDRVVEVVAATLQGNTMQLLSRSKVLPRLDAPKVSVRLCVGGVLGRRDCSHRSHASPRPGPAQPARGHHPPLDRVPGAVHLLQNQARTRRAGVVCDGDAGGARGGRGRRPAGPRDLAVERGHWRLRSGPGCQPAAAAASHGGRAAQR